MENLSKYSDGELARVFVMLAKELAQRSHGILKSADLLVYMNMYDQYLLYREKGEGYKPSNASLAKCSGCTAKTVSGCQEKLESLGLITNTFKKNGCKYEYTVNSWLQCPEIMQGTLDSEERDVYLEERKEKAHTNHVKAQEALQQPTEPQGKQSHTESVKASQSGAQKTTERKQLYYAQSEIQLFKYVSEQLGRELDESIITYLRDKAVYGQVIYNEKFKHNVYINYGGKVG